MKGGAGGEGMQIGKSDPECMSDDVSRSAACSMVSDDTTASSRTLLVLYRRIVRLCCCHFGSCGGEDCDIASTVLPVQAMPAAKAKRRAAPTLSAGVYYERLKAA